MGKEAQNRSLYLFHRPATWRPTWQNSFNRWILTYSGDISLDMERWTFAGSFMQPSIPKRAPFHLTAAGRPLAAKAGVDQQLLTPFSPK